MDQSWDHCIHALLPLTCYTLCHMYVQVYIHTGCAGIGHYRKVAEMYICGYYGQKYKHNACHNLMADDVTSIKYTHSLIAIEVAHIRA